MPFSVPDSVAVVLDALRGAGYRAYPVGGCVRDIAMGRIPQDWDICTAALPHQVKAVLADYPTVDTGIKHGTVRVMTDATGVEVTTFRIDGDYTDSRHPESVVFTDDLTADLARRDFTVNAMAFDEALHILDPFGGREDIQKRIIRCVGDARARFSQDALRILRALRFASALGFAIEESTLAAMEACAPLLQHISAERISAEWCALLLGENVAYALNTAIQTGVMEQILPEFMPMVGFSQHNPHHDKSVSAHTIAAVANAPPELAVRLTMLLHDIGKPACFTMDEKGTGHFYGHAANSVALAREVLTRLRLPSALIVQVCNLIKHHGDKLMPTPAFVRRLLNRMGEEGALRLLRVKRADALSKAPPYIAASLASIDEFEALLHREIAEQSCFSLKELAVSGTDLIKEGYLPGPAMGQLLDTLLGAVMDGSVPNEKEALLSHAQALSFPLE